MVYNWCLHATCCRHIPVKCAGCCKVTTNSWMGGQYIIAETSTPTIGFIMLTDYNIQSILLHVHWLHQIWGLWSLLEAARGRGKVHGCCELSYLSSLYFSEQCSEDMVSFFACVSLSSIVWHCTNNHTHNMSSVVMCYGCCWFTYTAGVLLVCGDQPRTSEECLSNRGELRYGWESLWCVHMCLLQRACKQWWGKVLIGMYREVCGTHGVGCDTMAMPYLCSIHQVASYKNCWEVNSSPQTCPVLASNWKHMESMEHPSHGNSRALSISR